MIDEYHFWKGFSFGTGMVLAFILFIIIPTYLNEQITKLIGIMNKNKKKYPSKAHANKLSLDILDQYHKKLKKDENWTEYGEFEKHIYSFENNESMEEFFNDYEIVEKELEDSERTLFKKSEKFYKIKKKKNT